jgi:hypothetical protein
MVRLLVDAAPVLSGVLPVDGGKREAVMTTLLHEYTNWADPSGEGPRGREAIRLFTGKNFTRR